MKYKVPKEVEKVPIVAGLPIGSVVVVILSVLLAIVSMSTSYYVSLFFLTVGGGYVAFENSYPREGQALDVLRFHINPKVIRFNKPIDKLIRHDRKE